MASLDELKAARDALIAQRGKPAAEVEFEGRRVKYKSDREIAAAIAALDREIAALESGGRLRIIYTSTSKGIE